MSEQKSLAASASETRITCFVISAIIPLNSPTLPVLIPPAFGLQGIGFETYTGDGPISYWNSYVGVSQMGAQGTFNDPRIGVFITQRPDRVTPKLPALLDYQLSLPAAVPPSGSFNAAAARRGERLFNGKAACATCHKPPTFARLNKDWDADIRAFDEVYEHILHMADALSDGIVTQFSNKFA